MGAPILQGANPVQIPGGFVAVAETRTRPADDEPGLRSTAQFRWPVLVPKLDAWEICSGELVNTNSTEDGSVNGLFQLGPVRPVVPITTTVACSIMGADPSEWEAIALEQHSRLFRWKVAQLASVAGLQYTDPDGNKTANLADSPTVLATAPTGYRGAVAALRGNAAQVAPNELGSIWVSAGVDELLGEMVNLTPGGLPTVGVNRVPLINDAALTLTGDATAARVYWTRSPSVRVSLPSVVRHDPGQGEGALSAPDWTTNDAHLTVTQWAVWDWPAFDPAAAPSALAVNVALDPEAA